MIIGLEQTIAVEGRLFMSAINKLRVIIILVCLMFVQAGCFQNTSSKALNEEEPVVVILDEDSYDNKDNKKPNEIKYNKIPTIYNEYNVDLKVKPEEKTFEGIQKIKYTNQTENPLEMIYLNLYLNAFKKNSTIKPYLLELEDKIYYKGFNEGFIDIKSVLVNNEEVLFNQSETLLEISLKAPMEIKESIIITIQFNGKVPEIAYRIGANGNSLWMGNFLPTLAVYDKSGWNKSPYYPVGDPFYADISNYIVKVTTPKDYVVVATGEEEECEKEKDKITTINAQMVRDFAIAISNQFSKTSLETKEGVDINFYYTDNNINSENILKISERSLRYYGKILGSYPYSELDIVEGELLSPTCMEYSTLILMNSKLLEETQSVLSIAHEIGHQWFYNIIGSNQIKEPWLDEAMVMYLQQNMFLLEEDIKDLMNKERDKLITAMNPMREVSLYSDLSTFSSWETYYNIHYIRGQLMIHGLREKMGEEKFNEFLKAYYQKYAFKIVDTEGFIDTAEEVYGSSLGLFFSEWMSSEILPEF